MFSMFRHHASRPSVEEAAAPLSDALPAPDNPGTPDPSLADRVLASETNHVPVVEPDASNGDLPDGRSSAVREEDRQFADSEDGTSAEQVMPPDVDQSADARDDYPSAVTDDVEMLVEDVDRPAHDAGLRGLAQGARRRGSSRALTKKPTVTRPPLTAQQRLLMLDTWIRSGLPAGDFAPLIGISKHTLCKWKEQFQELGPAGLMDQPRRVRRGSQLPELTRRTILMLKEAHPEWGCQRIYHLQSVTMSPCSMAKAFEAKVRQTWFCEGCLIPKDSYANIDVQIEELVPADSPLNFVHGGPPLAKKDFLNDLDGTLVFRDLHLGRVYGPNGNVIDDWVTFRGRHRLIIRGTKNVSLRHCSQCGRTVYFAMGKRYL